MKTRSLSYEYGRGIRIGESLVRTTLCEGERMSNVGKESFRWEIGRPTLARFFMKKCTEGLFFPSLRTLGFETIWTYFP